MTTTINAAYVKTMLNDTELATATAEELADHAINTLNVYGAGLSNLTGEAESKTGTYTSQQAGAITCLLREAYRIYKNAAGQNTAISGVSVSFSDSRILSMAKNLAFQLKSRSFNTA